MKLIDNYTATFDDKHLIESLVKEQEFELIREKGKYEIEFKENLKI